MLINWKRGNPQANLISLMMVLFVVMISISLQATNPTVDNFGHIGGLIYGFFLLPLISRPESDNDCLCCDYNTWKIICIAFSIIFYIGGFALFFLVRNPPQVKF